VLSRLFERKRARRADVAAPLSESVIRNSPAAIALLRGPDYTIEMVNPAYQELSPGEPMVGKTVAELWPEAAPLVIPLLRAVRDGGIAYRGTGQAVPLHRGPGSPVEVRYFDFSYVPLARDGEPLILVVATEVTAHKRVEAELRAACAELAAIHANAPMVLFVVNDEFRVEKVNDLAARFAGRASADLVGQRTGDAFGCLSALANSAGCGKGAACAGCPIRAAALDSLTNGARHEGVEAWMPRSVNGAAREECAT
jgi:PAS domain-containing protein